MAKRSAKDIGLNSRLNEIEQRIFQLKIQYEKYFSGIERIEPVKDLEALRRIVRDLSQQRIVNTQQRYRFTQLKARLSSLDMYWKRNLIMIERGTHPKMKFRADIKERNRREAELNQKLQKEKAQRRKDASNGSQDSSYRSVFDQLVEARRSTGQSTNISYDSIKANLEQQTKAIKSKYNCDSVRFKVSIKDGKAKMKAVPVHKKEE